MFSLFAGCGSGRNQPNDFLPLLVGKPRVNDKKNRAGANLPNGDVPILFLIMGSVPNRYGVRVVKDKRSRLEINVVSGEIFMVLLLIVLESHDLNSAEDKHGVHTLVNTRARVRARAQKAGALKDTAMGDP